MSIREQFLNKIGFTGNVDNLKEVLDFMDEKKIYIETKVESAETLLGFLHDYSAKVYHIPSGMNKVLITETPNCSTLAGVLRLSVLYAARYLSEKIN
jgi:hypothetical protein